MGLDDYPDGQEEKHKLSSLEASFASSLHQLGANGFRDWLLHSFGGETPEHKVGHFHLDEPAYSYGCVDGFTACAQGIKTWSQENENDVFVMAQQGAGDALGHFDPGVGTYYGLYEIGSTAMALECYDHVPRLQVILNQWISADGIHKPLIEGNDILCLRETLESVFCLLHKIKSQGNLSVERLRDFQTMCRWADEVMVNVHDTAIEPAFAPLHVLARLDVHYFMSDPRVSIARADFLKQRLAGVHLRDGVMFPGFYTAAASNEKKYPFNFDMQEVLIENLIETPS